MHGTNATDPDGTSETEVHLVCCTRPVSRTPVTSLEGSLRLDGTSATGPDGTSEEGDKDKEANAMEASLLTGGPGLSTTVN